MPGLPPTDELRGLVDAFASTSPVPAGGAAAVLAIALGAALGIKVGRISSGPDTDVARLVAAIDEVLPLGAADCEAFRRVLATRRAGEPDAIVDAWRNATTIPIAIAKIATDAHAAVGAMRAGCKPALRADLDAALALLRTGRGISVENARTNADQLPSPDAVELLAALREAAGRAPPTRPLDSGDSGSA